jgi:hypothetical protein
LYPLGHLGLAAVTFLVILPLTQVIVVSEGRLSISNFLNTVSFVSPGSATAKAKVHVLPLAM